MRVQAEGLGQYVRRVAAAAGGWGTMRRLPRSADLRTLDTCENYSTSYAITVAQILS